MCACVHTHTYLCLQKVQVFLSYFCYNRSRFSIQNIKTSTSEVNNYQHCFRWPFLFPFPCCLWKEGQVSTKELELVFPFSPALFPKMGYKFCSPQPLCLLSYRSPSAWWFLWQSSILSQALKDSVSVSLVSTLNLSSFSLCFLSYFFNGLLTEFYHDWK